MTKRVRAYVCSVIYNNDMSDWRPLVLLPNLNLDNSIEIDQIALLPRHDQQITELAEKHPNFRAFLDKFTDAFGVPLSPCVIAGRENIDRKTYTVEAVASFRDIISVSVIPLQQALEIRYPRGLRILYSNSFAIYPWMIDRDYDDIVAFTPVMTALHEVRKFNGQCQPELPHCELTKYDVDVPLLASLLTRWNAHYAGKGTRKWKNRALFRSLNMANAAMQLPGGLDTTFYDRGRMIALWISAFEILAHPQIGRSGLGPVYKLLSNITWESRRSGYLKYRAYNRDAKPPNRNLACWLYGELYKARNDFLHGEPIRKSRLTIKGSNRNLYQFVAPLFRLALTGYLPLSWQEQIPSLSDCEKFAEFYSRHSDFIKPQRTIEEAISISRIRDIA